MSAVKILLTGASGYLGGAAARAIAKKGHHVTALLRDPKRAPPDVKLYAVAGDLADRALVEKLVADADAVVHCAIAGDAAPADAIVIDAVAKAKKPIVYTSGV